MRWLYLLLTFLALGGFFIISNHDIHLNTGQDMDKFQGLYYNWLSGIFTNFKSITGYVVKYEWLPDEPR
jgi:hypothetical protein